MNDYPNSEYFIVEKLKDTNIMHNLNLMFRR